MITHSDLKHASRQRPREQLRLRFVAVETRPQPMHRPDAGTSRLGRLRRRWDQLIQALFGGNPRFPQSVGATDAELARLSQFPAQRDSENARWQLIYQAGVVPPR